ncbi:MAG: Ig-like domain-containing protein [Solobacterium sp.]|nr:Ig-like domain-containing protein [Solobacterium sp.]
MRPACRTDRILKAVFCGVLLIAAGCRRTPVRTISTGEWLHEINERSGIPQDQSPPYFIDISESSLYYQTIQDAAGWGIVDTQHPLDPQSPLSKEFAAYTLINLAGTQPASSGTVIHDIGDSPYRVQIESAVSLGLFRTDSRNCFHPKELLDRDEAMKKLDQVISYINCRIPEPVTVDELTEFCTEEPISGDPAKGYAVYHASAGIREGTYIQERDTGQWYRVTDTEEHDEETFVHTEPAGPEDVFGSMHIQGSGTVDFESAEILDEFTGDNVKSSYTENSRMYLAALYYHPHLSRSYTFNGYEISWGVSSSGISAQVSRNLPNGLKFHSAFRLSNVRPVYEWQFGHGTVENGYFRVDCLMTEETGITGSSSRRISGDLSQIDPYDLLNSVRRAFREDNDTVDLVIPLCTLRVPLPEQPLLSLIIRLELSISAEGKAEFTCRQQLSAGMEIRNGKLRMIHDCDNSHKETLTASAETTADLFFGLNAGGLTLADIGMLGGIRAEVRPPLHLYRGSRHTAVQETDVPYDLLDDNTSPAFLVCADLNAGWLLSLDVNSSSSLCGKLGLSCSKEVLDPEKNSILPAGMHHMENGMFVRTCTRSDYETLRKSEVPKADRIRISSYSLIMDPGETMEIPVSSVPEGYSIQDLTAVSDDTSIAEVQGLQVHANRPGSTKITVRTADGQFTVSCSVLVRSKPL